MAEFAYQARVLDEDGNYYCDVGVAIDNGRLEMDYTKASQLPPGRYVVEPVDAVSVRGVFDVEAETREQVFEALLGDWRDCAEGMLDERGISSYSGVDRSEADWRKRWKEARDG